MAKSAPPRSWDRLTELLWEAAEKGNVPAMRILRDEMKAADGDQGTGKATKSVIDELAERRKSGTG